MRLRLLFESFEPWEFHEYIVKNPHASDLISMLRLLKKNLDPVRIRGFLADMIPDWNEKVFPHFSKQEVEEINKEVRKLDIPEHFLIVHGFSEKASKDFTFHHEIYFNQAVDWMLNGDWVPSLNQLKNVYFNNQKYFKDLDQEKQEEFASFIENKIKEDKEAPTFKDAVKRVLNPDDNPDELGI